MLHRQVIAFPALIKVMKEKSMEMLLPQGIYLGTDFKKLKIDGFPTVFQQPSIEVS